MNKIYEQLFIKIYNYFYFYCISGRSEERELLLKQQRDVENTGDNNLIYLFQIMKYANGIDSDPRDRSNFISKVEECEHLVKDKDFDTWCYHQVLFLCYTYIYPDAAEAKRHERDASEWKQKLSDEDKASAEKLTNVFDREDYEIEKHFEKKLTMIDAYKERLSDRDFRLQKRSFLMILKGFSSSTPFFYPALENRFYQSPIKGGGFFIKWQGYGIAIDPGINFMENMHANGLGIGDINAVIVTHDHIDHNGDLQTIDDLAYSAGGNCEIELYMDPGTYGKSQIFASMKKKHLLDVFTGRKFNIGRNEEIQIEIIDTKHMPDSEETYKENTTFALKIILEKNLKIGFTADTKYFSELGEFMKGCNYIIANMSEPEENDYRKIKFKDRHLGYRGCFELIKACNNTRSKKNRPRYIISEFWAGKGDTRRELIKKLRQETGYNEIYPGDIGMMLFLDRRSFLCDYCGCETGMEKLHLIRDKREYGKLSFVCDDCLLI